jgi:hypothetical protein
MTTKAGIFYTNNILDETIFTIVLGRLRRQTTEMEVVSVSHKPVDFGKNIVVELPSSAESILKQILIGCENTKADVVYLLEHDVLYHPTYFEKVPKDARHFLYNTNVWQVNQKGEAFYRLSMRTSQLIVYREALIFYLKEVLAVIKKRGWTRVFGVAPMTHEINDVRYRGKRLWEAPFPNIDLRHGKNFSPNYVLGENEMYSDEVPGWGKTLGRFDEFLQECA